jgi:hypothetical protein
VDARPFDRRPGPPHFPDRPYDRHGPTSSRTAAIFPGWGLTKLR